MKLRFWKDIVIAFFWAAFFHFVVGKLPWKRIKELVIVALGPAIGMLILVAIGTIAFTTLATSGTMDVVFVSLVGALVLLRAAGKSQPNRRAFRHPSKAHARKTVGSGAHRR